MFAKQIGVNIHIPETLSLCINTKPPAVLINGEQLESFHNGCQEKKCLNSKENLRQIAIAGSRALNGVRWYSTGCAEVESSSKRKPGRPKMASSSLRPYVLHVTK